MRRVLLVASMSAALLVPVTTPSSAAVVGEVILAADTTTGASVVFSAVDGGQRAARPAAYDLTHAGAPRGFVYSRALTPDGHVELFAAGEDSTVAYQLTSDLAVTIVAAAWSPDGKRLAYTGTRVDSEGKVVEQGAYIGDVRFDAARRPVGLATVRFAFAMQPENIVWSGDNHRLTFAQDVPNVPDVYVGDVDSGSVVNVTATAGVAEYDPAFSPTQNRIAFVKRTNKSGLYRNDIFVLNLDNRRVTQVTAKSNTSAVQISHPSFAPGGSAIAFAGWGSSLASPAADIYRIPADGSAKATNLTGSSPDTHYLPRWRR